MSPGERVRPNRKLSGKLAGKLAEVVEGPLTMGGVSGMWIVAGVEGDTAGTQETWHQSHLRPANRPNLAAR